MGFYAPAQLIRAAREDGVEVRPVDVLHSDWESSLESDANGSPCIRLGLRVVKGLSMAGGKRMVNVRSQQKFSSVRDLAQRAQLYAKDLACLASASAFRSFASNRYQARWQVAGIEPPTPLSLESAEAVPLLNSPSEGQNIVADYQHLGLTLGRHPLAVLRHRLNSMRINSANEIHAMQHGQRVRAAGLVITRQRPASAAGVTFITIEDETGYLNLIVWEKVALRERKALLSAALMSVEGHVQKEGDVIHIVAHRLHDHSSLLGSLAVKSRNFH
jgi:error-prone DNA polymerase